MYPRVDGASQNASESNALESDALDPDALDEEAGEPRPKARARARPRGTRTIGRGGHKEEDEEGPVEDDGDAKDG